ncbi:hypothetical protein [Algivirga pacifica]|uniref:Peptidoglycan binding domain-containing protein n=1 Tax=Algivirga pacifica TaxID=1162670 RepID=A0ABP9DEU9_9BACT
MTGLLIGGALVAALLMTNSSKRLEITQPQKPTGPLTIATETKPAPPSGFPLRYGSQNNYVKRLQQAMLKIGDDYVKQSINKTGGADGKWGPGTEKARVHIGFPAQIDQTFYQSILKMAANNQKTDASSWWNWATLVLP